MATLTGCSPGDDDAPDGSGGITMSPGSGGGETTGTGGSGTGGVGTGGSTPIVPGEGIWPSYDEARASEKSTKTLIVLIDFDDVDIDTINPNAEAEWARLMFGTEPGEGNHYWYETSAGQFQLLQADETSGTPNDGVVRVKVSGTQPQTGPVQTESQTWIPEALDTLAASVDFAAFDSNADTILSNDELTVLFILPVASNVLAIADAQANIALGYSIPGTGVSLDKFTRATTYLGALGVPMHELGHHIFGLKHSAGETQHDLMGQGSYGEDPEVGTFHNMSYKSATRPTGLMAYMAIQAGFMAETMISGTTLGVELHSPELGQKRNAVVLPVKDGFLYISNRTSWSYDKSIPFCEGSAGGLFVVELSQYLKAVNLPGVARDLAAVEHFEGELDFCEFYAHEGHHDSVEYGGWRLENISAAGPTMRVDIVKTEEDPVLDHYKLGYWVTDTTREGYRRKVFKRIDATNTPNMDFAEMVMGDTTATRFPVWLDAYYTTGEVRGVNTTASWNSDNPYVSIGIDGTPFTNEGAILETAIAIIRYNTAQPHVPNATFTVSAGDLTGTFTMSNIPAP